MSPHENLFRNHSVVTPTSSLSSFSTISTTTLSSSTNRSTTSVDGDRDPIFKLNFISWRVLGAIFATALVVGWVFIIVVLIQEEKWQLVLVAWLLLYAAAHFCYWYFKRHHLFSIHSRICGRVRGDIGSVSDMEKGFDAPPSYEDVIKSEPPPPTYYSVVQESPISPQRSFFPRFPWQGLPRMFGKKSQGVRSENPAVSEDSAAASSSSCSVPSFFYSKRSDGKSPPNGVVSTTDVAASISSSGSIPQYPVTWKTSSSGIVHLEPPPYTRSSYIDIESQVTPPRFGVVAAPSSFLLEEGSRTLSSEGAVSVSKPRKDGKAKIEIVTTDSLNSSPQENARDTQSSTVSEQQTSPDTQTSTVSEPETLHDTQTSTVSEPQTSTSSKTVDTDVHDQQPPLLSASQPDQNVPDNKSTDHNVQP